jgi:hypothetical protein
MQKRTYILYTVYPAQYAWGGDNQRFPRNGSNKTYQDDLTGHYLNSVDLTGHYLNSILQRRTEELQRKAAEIERLCDAPRA